MISRLDIAEFDYPLEEERIARFPLESRDASKLLVWRGRASGASICHPDRAVGDEGSISESKFNKIGEFLPDGSLLVFNDTRVVRARLVMHKPGEGGARVEVLCLEPREPADYERAFAARGTCEWLCMVGNSKKWKSGPLEIAFDGGALSAWRSGENVRFEWSTDHTFGQLLELLGRVPIPPYLGRDSSEVDNRRYQTVYARIEGSVAAPTAGLHFTPELIAGLELQGVNTERVTLHVGAGTFLPVKTVDALEHEMHTEYFEVTCAALERLLLHHGRVIAVGTTSVRTLESLAALGWRIASQGTPALERAVGQFESYYIPADFDGRAALEALAGWMRTNGHTRLSASTRIMITPAGFRFRIVGGLVTNFHQPRSTLLLLVSAFTGGDWRRIYDHALAHDFRFLSYGDSSLLLP